MTILIVAMLIGIVFSLGQALFAMTGGPEQSARMAKALTYRIGLSVALFGILMLAWHFGFIEPHTVR